MQMISGPFSAMRDVQASNVGHAPASPKKKVVSMPYRANNASIPSSSVQGGRSGRDGGFSGWLPLGISPCTESYSGVGEAEGTYSQ